jgi:hypothetical protein
MDAEKAGQPELKDQRGRRPYERPAIGWEEDFEPYVYSTCAKMPGQGAPCAGTKSS